MADAMQILAENKILEAMEKGAFDHLTGKGKPLCFYDSHLPSEVRVLYKVLQNSGCQPVEVILHKEIAALAAQLQSATDPTQKAALKQQLTDKQINLAIIMERKRLRR